MDCTGTLTSRLLEPIPGLLPSDVISGNSPVMDKIRQKLEKAASANIAVLLKGQSGSGKEVIAKLVHSQSPWRNGPFVKVSCPAIPGALIESELFGYEKGAFTGAQKSKFFLGIFYPLRNLSWRAILRFSLQLNCMAKRRELSSRSRGSLWRMA